MDPSIQMLALDGPAAITLGVIVLACVVAALVWLIGNLSGSKLAPVACLLAGFCLDAVLITPPSIQVGLQIFPDDVISLIVLLSVLVGTLRRPLPLTDGPFLLWLGFGVAIIVSFIVGLQEYGRYAGVEFRPFFYLWVAGLYCSAAGFDEADLRIIARWCHWTAYALVAIAAFFWLSVETGLMSRSAFVKAYDDAGGGFVFRPVTSEKAFFVATAAAAHTMAWLRGTGGRRSGWHAFVFIAFVVLIQHRSVWVAGLAGLFLVLVFERRYLARRIPSLFGAALVAFALLAIAAALGQLDDIIEKLEYSTSTMFDSGGTFAARIDGWYRLLDSLTGEAWLFGFPFGHGYRRIFNGQYIDFGPHNFLLDLVLRVGLLGTVLFMWPTLSAIVRSLRRKGSSEFEYLVNRGLAVGLLASLVYFVAYPSYYILGGATAVAWSLSTRRRTVPRAPVAVGMAAHGGTGARWRM